MTSFLEYASDSIGYKVNKAARLITQKLAKDFRLNNIEVTPEQWQILLYLYREDGQAQNSLVESTGKDAPIVSRVIDTMEKHKLVFRVRHPSDRRTNLIYLTESGKTLQESLVSMGHKTNTEVTRGIAPEEVEICVRILNKIIKNLS